MCKKRIVLLIVLIGIGAVVGAAFWLKSKPHEVARLYFPENFQEKLFINGQPLFSVGKAKRKVNMPFSFSALTPNTISLGDVAYSVRVDEIKPRDFITIFVGKEKITVNLFPGNMSLYKIKKKGARSGYLLFTLFNGACILPSYAYIVHTNGNLLYYRKNEHADRCVSDFKKTTLPNGEVVFSMMEQEKPMPPVNWWYGSLLIFDSQLKLITKLKLLPSKEHSTLDVENHDSLILDKNHVILSTYYQTEVMIPGQEYPSRVAGVLIQEIKDGEIIFEWNSINYPQLYRACLGKCAWGGVAYQDYLHFNSIVVDPKDNNLILSLGAASSLIKIDRKTGDILWTLGGRNDDYSLRAHQHFSSQHTVSFLPSGELMLFDNHSSGVASKQATAFPLPGLDTVSRILIFKLDEKNRQIEHFNEITLPYLANSMGSAYYTGEDTFIVGYGSCRDMLAQEVDVNGKIRLSMKLRNPSYVSYRVQKYSSLN